MTELFGKTLYEDENRSNIETGSIYGLNDSTENEKMIGTFASVHRGLPDDGVGFSRKCFVEVG